MSGRRRKPRRPIEILWSARAKDDELLIADVERAAEMPFSGRVVPELPNREDIREMLRRTYRIVYRVRQEAIEVLTVFEGHRLFPPDAIPEDEP